MRFGLDLVDLNARNFCDVRLCLFGMFEDLERCKKQSYRKEEKSKKSKSESTPLFIVNWWKGLAFATDNES